MISVRLVSVMGYRLAVFGAIIPGCAILVTTLMAALHPRLQGMLITALGLALFIMAMQLMPRLKIQRGLAGGNGSRTNPAPA